MANEPFTRAGYVRLDKNENTVGLPPDLLREILQSVTPEQVASYPEPFLFKTRLASFLGIGEERLTTASGSDAVIKACFEAYINPGDSLVTISPTYAMVDVYSALFGAATTRIGYSESLELDYGSLMAAVTRGAKMIYIANPNSPTGTAISMEQIEELCSAASKRGALILVDEAYYYFTPVTAFKLLPKYENLIITRTFSKVAGIASVRLGYAVSSAEVTAMLGRWRPMYETNFFAEHCGRFVLDHWDRIEAYAREVVETREWFCGQLAESGFEVYPSQTNFVLIRYPENNIAAMVERFRSAGILIKGGGAQYPLSSCLRMSIGARSQMERCLELLVSGERS